MPNPYKTFKMLLVAAWLGIQRFKVTEKQRECLARVSMMWLDWVSCLMSSVYKFNGGNIWVV